MSERLTDDELTELERRVRPGYVELFPHEIVSLLAEVRELRAFQARVEGYRERLAAEMRASARRLAFFRYDTHARVIAELAAYAALGEYDAAVFGESAESEAKPVAPEKTELARFIEASPGLMQHAADALSREFVGEPATRQTLAIIEHRLKTALERAYRERYGADLDTTDLAVSLGPVSGAITIALDPGR